MTNISFESGSALVSASRGPIAPAYETETLEQIYRLSETFAKAGLAPSQGVAVAKALRGLALGLDIMQSHDGFVRFPYQWRHPDWDVGKELSSLVRSRGVIVRLTNDPTDPHAEDLSYARWVARIGEDEVAATYTANEAKAVGLWSKWEKGKLNPRNMLVWRAASRLIDRHLSHIIGAGLPTAESLEEGSNAEPERYVATVTQVGPQKPTNRKRSLEPTVEGFEARRKKLEDTLQGEVAAIEEAWEAWGLPQKVTPENVREASLGMDEIAARAPLIFKIWSLNSDLRELSEEPIELDQPWKKTVIELRSLVMSGTQRLRAAQWRNT